MFALLCRDYEGWPKEEELPVKFLTEEHRELIAEKCSNEEEPEMPTLPTALPLLVTAGDKKDGKMPAITPPPAQDQAVIDGQAQVIVGAATAKSGKGGKKKKGGITPSPMPPKGNSKKQAAVAAGSAASGKPAAAAKKPVSEKQKKANVAMHQKWQAEADKRGGGKIVVR